MSCSPHYWSLRCGRLERESGDSSALASQLREKLQHEMTLTNHWRQQVDLRHCRMSLFVAELNHYNFAGEPLKGSLVSLKGRHKTRPQVIDPLLPPPLSGLCGSLLAPSA
uniref:Uncharacterized protein n=1 Tax=Peronospora matthiolae TaxID=2874970 RepID=A0AAV1T9B2_9STRA